MYITIDAGNTRIKTALFEKGNIIQENEFQNLEEIIHFVRDQKPEKGILSSVRALGAKNQRSIIQIERSMPLIQMNYQTPVPLTNFYSTPQTLGMDRLAGCIGARTLYPEEACLVIDAGTCITYDYINREDEYFGGIISPGLEMRFKALNHFTAGLPMIELPEEDTHIPLVGDSTRNAILSGVVNGLIAETKGIIEFYRREYTFFKIIFCGGNANFFERKIKLQIFAVPNLIHFGLNRILEYNVAIQNI